MQLAKSLPQISRQLTDKGAPTFDRVDSYLLTTIGPFRKPAVEKPKPEYSVADVHAGLHSGR
jgi:hypothetical protein